MSTVGLTHRDELMLIGNQFIIRIFRSLRFDRLVTCLCLGICFFKCIEYDKPNKGYLHIARLDSPFRILKGLRR